MSRNVTDYLQQFLSLLPPGKLWSTAPASRLYEMHHGLSEEMVRVDDRAVNFLTIERDTRYTVELIDDHEEDFGLPEGCLVGGVPFFPNMSITERQLRLNGKLRAVGQQNKEYFIDVAAAYGLTATITEFTPAWCGVHEAGEACGDQDNIFYWQLNITYSGEIFWALSGEAVAGTPISKVTDLIEAIFCYAEIYKPAHTVLIHNIVGPAFGYGFDDAFDSYPSAGIEHLEGPYGWDDWGSAFDVARNVAYTKAFEETDFGVHPSTE